MTYALHLGDCLAGLHRLREQVDVVITDPPYSEHVHSHGRRSGAGPAGANGGHGGIVSTTRDLGFASLDPIVRCETANHLARLVRRWVLIFCDIESAHLWSADLDDAGLDVVRVGLWIKQGSTPQFTGDRPAVGAEAIVIAHPPGRKRWSGGGRHGVWTHPIVNAHAQSTERRVHPTQKPVALMEALVRDFTEPGELVLDPYAGSGTTGCAALRLGRRFLGWEMSPEHHATAARRLSMAREQLDLLAGI